MAASHVKSVAALGTSRINRAAGTNARQGGAPPAPPQTESGRPRRGGVSPISGRRAAGQTAGEGDDPRPPRGRKAERGGGGQRPLAVARPRSEGDPSTWADRQGGAVGHHPWPLRGRRAPERASPMAGETGGRVRHEWARPGVHVLGGGGLTAATWWRARASRYPHPSCRLKTRQGGAGRCRGDPTGAVPSAAAPRNATRGWSWGIAAGAGGRSSTRDI